MVIQKNHCNGLLEVFLQRELNQFFCFCRSLPLYSRMYRTYKRELIYFKSGVENECYKSMDKDLENKNKQSFKLTSLIMIFLLIFTTFKHIFNFIFYQQFMKKKYITLIEKIHQDSPMIVNISFLILLIFSFYPMKP